MALSTYTELQAAVADYMIRTDLTNPIIDAIRLVEATLNYGGAGAGGVIKPLRIRQMELRATATMTSGDDTIALPTDFLASRELKITSSTNSGVPPPLRYITPEMLDELYSPVTTGKPEAFTIIGSEYRFRPVPDSAYTLENNYYKPIPPLASNATNWLLTAAPQVYLRGALAEMRSYMKDQQEADRQLAQFTMAVEALRRGDRDARYAGPLQMRPQNVV